MTTPISKLNMKEDPELYSMFNGCQKSCAEDMLRIYASKYKWRNQARVLDIGCGDGSVTTNILKKYIPEDYSALVGCDKSEKMLCHARKHYQSERIVFMFLDIVGELPTELIGSFDHIFCSFVLHWTKQNDVSFTNIHDLLTPVGDCLLFIMGTHPFYEITKRLERMERWNSIFYNVDNFVSLYHNLEHPRKMLSDTLTHAGFRAVEVDCLSLEYTFESFDVFINSFYIILPYTVLEEDFEKFKEDVLDIYNDLTNSSYTVSEPITIHYVCNIVYASK